MGLLKKLIVFEDDKAETTAPVPVQEEPTEEVPIAVDADIESPANIIDEIYDQNDLSDKTNSIFTVQALIATLPPEMPTATKQATIAGILAVSGIKVETLLSDGDTRMSMLKAAESKITRERTTEIEIAKMDIEALKQAIESANIKIKEAEDIISAAQSSITDEVKSITNLIEFCKGMEESK